ncbi:peptidoglycan DD-metalloendopeptidase family protein [Arcicella sp. DC2W]|uniref:Peptidoglycan DD-metalloendopeptidase family protein n=1 Tax=Arcicella gelida TaxID=2984195 RepID=A0ABU5S6D6_9BACT|nr:peptidoglycan DD-metalloendopeptidase family protein [Arcicella sp. DC2W]MEA5404052.1 peptidoglycan DD-metalloendopeptidase family protein [Arcicella sp. DC2W]
MNLHIKQHQAALKFVSGLLLVLLYFVPNLSTAQDKKKKLEAAKRENLQKIQEINKIIEKTEQKKEASVGKLNALGERIDKQAKQIDIISENQQLLQNEAEELKKATGELSGNLEKLKAEYAKMVFTAAKTSNKVNKLSFLFSSSNFNQLIRRYKYLQQYSSAREKQALLIQQVRSELLTEQVKILQKKQEQDAVLREKITETQNLQVLKGKQTEVVTELSQKEKKLRAQLEANKKVVERLEAMIAKIVEREIKRSQERELLANKRSQNNKKVTSNRQAIAMNVEETRLASSFSALRGRMPWPVNSGFIASRFGVHNHPVLKGVKTNNNGIDIQTSAGNDVRVVYDGVVQSVVSIPGTYMVVAIQHGDYFTIYSKLSNVSVRNGQRVQAGQKVGEVASDTDGTSELNFQVWKTFDKQNPENWLRQK